MALAGGNEEAIICLAVLRLFFRRGFHDASQATSVGWVNTQLRLLNIWLLAENTLKQQKETVNLTVAQAIIKYLSSQYIEIDGEKVRLCGGGFGIFGHGNVTCLGEALYENKDKLPLYRGQNEQGMGFAAAAYAKAHLRRRFMFCTASAGPGTTNLLTSAALAHANRLPMLMLCGDTFITRLPDPVLQQLEHFGNPTLGVNDAFKSVSRFWDRITHPAQIIQSLPAALETMLDPADWPCFSWLTSRCSRLDI